MFPFSLDTIRLPTLRLMSFPDVEDARARLVEIETKKKTANMAKICFQEIKIWKF